MKKKKRVPVSERAVLDRVNRQLAKKQEAIKICRKGPRLKELGRYFLVSTQTTGELLKSRVNLTEYAEGLGALHSWEFIVRKVVKHDDRTRTAD